MTHVPLTIDNTVRITVRCITGFLLLLMANAAHSGPLDVVWEKSDGDFTSVTLESVAAMPDGGLLLGGSITTSTALLAPSPAYLIRTDTNGRKLWAKAFWRGPGNVLGVPQGSIGASFATEDGGFFCLEHFSATSGFNPSGQTGEFVIKTDAAGSRLWETYYSSYQATGPRVNAIAPAGDNGCAVLGYSREGCFWARLDSRGETVWRKVWSGKYVTLSKLVVGADGGFFLAGYQEVESLTVVRVIKVDSLGNFVWDKTFQHGTNTFTVAISIVGTPEGGCLIGGSTCETASANSAPLFLKLNAAGEKEWEQVWNDPNRPRPTVHTLIRLPEGDYLWAATLYSAGSPTSAYLARVAAPGRIVWEKSYGDSPSLTMLTRVFVTPSGAYGFLGTRGPTLNEMTPLLVKISSEARAEVWARYGSATIASPAATGFLTGREVSSLRGTEFEEPGRIMPR